MQQLRSNKYFLFVLLFLGFQGRAQESVSNVRLLRISPQVFRIFYHADPSKAKQIETVSLTIFRRRGEKVEEIFSSTVTRSVKLQSAGNYTYDWKADPDMVKQGDELQARVRLSLLQPIASTGKNNKLPRADAGSFLEVQLPVNEAVVLDGRRSSDSDGKIVRVRWKQIAGPSQVMINNPDSIRTTISGQLAEGRYGFELTVEDNSGALASDRIVMTIKAAPLVTIPKTEATGKKPDPLPYVAGPIVRAETKKAGFFPFKGGPANALINLFVPGLGHYLVSGDYEGHGRKPAAFAVTGLFLASAGGALYYHNQSDKQYQQYLDLANFREYQKDVNGNIIGVRGGDQAKAEQYYLQSQSKAKTAKLFAGIAAGIFTADLAYTFIKGMKNKTSWENNRRKTTVFISSDGTELTAGVRINLFR